MVRTTSLAFVALAVAASACQRDDSRVAERLDRIEHQLGELTRAVQAGGSGPAARPSAPRAERPRPNPEVTYSIPVDNAALKGRDDALVTVVEAYEFACPYCEQSRPLIDQILEAYPDDVRVAYKNFVVHPNTATIPATAACAANKQGKFAAIEPLIWDKGFKNGRKLDADHMKALAKEAGLDMARFETDMNGDECAKIVRTDQMDLRKIGVSGTPAFFVNGRWLRSRSFPAAKALIDEELARAKERIAGGQKRSSYYQDWIVEKGAKSL